MNKYKTSGLNKKNKKQKKGNIIKIHTLTELIKGEYCWIWETTLLTKEVELGLIGAWSGNLACQQLFEANKGPVVSVFYINRKIFILWKNSMLLIFKNIK